MNALDFSDYDAQSQTELSKMKFLNFEAVQKGVSGKDPFEGIRGKYEGQTIRGMTNVTPLVTMKFKGLTSDEIANRYFPVANPKINNEMIVVNDVDCTVDPKDFEIFSKQFYYDRNNNGTMESSEIAFNLVIYYSKNGLKIKEAFECITPNIGEILLFVENNEYDISNQRLYGKVAQDVRDCVKKPSHLYEGDVFDYVAKTTNINNIDLLKELMEKGFIEDKKTIATSIINGLYKLLKIVFTPGKAVAWVLDKIGNSIDTLKVPDKFWDTENEDYILSKKDDLSKLKIDVSLLDDLENQLKTNQKSFVVNNLAPDFLINVIQNNINRIRKLSLHYNGMINNITHQEDFSIFEEEIAYYCGFWNGIIDFISSLFKFVAMMLNAPYTIITNWQDILESYDSLIDAIISIDFIEIAKLYIDKIITFIKDSIKDGLNWVHIAYCKGEIMAFIGSFFIPFADLAKLVNLGNFEGKMGAIVSKIIKEVQSPFEKISTFVGNKTQIAYDNSLKLIARLIDILGNEGKLKQFFEKIWDAIAQWFLKNKKAFALIEKVDVSLIKFVDILKDNSWYLKALQLVQGNRKLGQWLAIESEAMVKMYTSYIYKALNEALRKGEKLTKELQAMQKVLDDALERLPVFNQRGKPLLRSTFFTEKEIKSLFKAGKDFIDKGFFSTTHSEEALSRWMQYNPADNVIFKVYGKNGKLIEKAAYKLDEYEVLFKSNTTFVVESVEKGYNYKFGRDITEIILKEK